MPWLGLGLGFGSGSGDSRGNATPDKGGGVPNPIVTQTIMRDSFIMSDALRMTDNG